MQFSHVKIKMNDVSQASRCKVRALKFIFKSMNIIANVLFALEVLALKNHSK